jgi:mannonate dehydratase
MPFYDVRPLAKAAHGLDQALLCGGAAGGVVIAISQCGRVKAERQSPIRASALSASSGSSNQLEFCQGTLSEMTGESSVYKAIETYARQGKIAYVHFRNVRGHVPDYDETFVDEGDVDMVKALRLYGKYGYRGVVMPDHAPAMNCLAPWHAGMAHALGWIGGALKALGSVDIQGISPESCL